MQLLLVTQEQIPSGKASCAFWTFKGLLFGVRSLMAFQMLQPGKGALAGPADMWTRLVGLGWGEIVIGGLGVYGNGRGFGLRSLC